MFHTFFFKECFLLKNLHTSRRHEVLVSEAVATTPPSFAALPCARGVGSAKPRCGPPPGWLRCYGQESKCDLCPRESISQLIFPFPWVPSVTSLQQVKTSLYVKQASGLALIANWTSGRHTVKQSLPTARADANVWFIVTPLSSVVIALLPRAAG